VDTVTATDMLMFVNAATTATGQREFRDDAREQRLSLEFLHEYMLGNYRDLYAAALALDINDHNVAIIVRRLLATSRDATSEQRATESLLITKRLRTLPPQRVYDLVKALRRAKVNNRRTRAIIREWMAARPDPAFDAVKYRTAVKEALRHAHLKPEGELGPFLFGRAPRYTTPILETWRRAHYEQAAIYDLPYTVAEGFAAKHRINRKLFMERIAPRMTQRERQRLTADIDGMSLTRLASYVLSLPLDARVQRRAELTEALRNAAARAVGKQRWGRVVAVLDDSYSTIGSRQKRRRPLAVALASHYLLDAVATSYVPLWTSGRTDALLAYPYGPTSLGERVVDALEQAPDQVVIVSDGWDNAPYGLAAEVLRVWRTNVDPSCRVSVVHLNPVYDADDFDVKQLSPHVPTVGVRDAEDVPALVEYARFTEGRIGLVELRAHFDDRARRFLEDG
jgi:hypothetical protein